jgi:predicted transcriptional regulator
MPSPIADVEDAGPAILSRLPPRERQVAAIVYRRGIATASDVCRLLPDAITNAAVRSMLSRLIAKGVVVRRRDGKRFHYLPSLVDTEREQALRRVSLRYFNGNLKQAAAALATLIVADAAQFQP